MKKLTAIATLIMISVTLAFAQNSKAEINRDIAFFERVLADDYIYAGEGGQTRNKVQTLEMFRKEKEKPTYKIIALKTEDVKAKVMGNTAILTGAWIFTSAPATDEKAEPHMDKGRYTSVLEKRNGKWLFVAEHVSEAPHDRKLMEQQVLKMGKEYGEMIRRGDAAAIERILADEYLYTDEKGKVKNKAEDLATYKNREYKIESVENSDQKVRVIGNNAAIETANFRVKGTGKDGKPFDNTYRYTTTWVWRGGRWQVAADHTSEVKQ
jgi:ketosteroid isomerase-like protein